MNTSSTAMNLFRQLSLSSLIAFPLLCVSPTLVGCDSSSDSEGSSSSHSGIWSLTQAQFETGLYLINLVAVNGASIAIVPDEGGTTGVMRVSGVSTPVNFHYSATGAVDSPTGAELLMTFTDPSAASAGLVLRQLGVTINPAEGETEGALAEGSAITFNLVFSASAYTPSTAKAVANNSFDEVTGNWRSFDGRDVKELVLSAWVNLDMLHGSFSMRGQ